jgi:hypothetical protein
LIATRASGYQGLELKMQANITIALDNIGNSASAADMLRVVAANLENAPVNVGEVNIFGELVTAGVAADELALIRSRAAATLERIAQALRAA